MILVTFGVCCVKLMKICIPLVSLKYWRQTPSRWRMSVSLASGMAAISCWV